MREIYGRYFTDSFGEEPSPQWIAAVGELSDDQCRNGIAATLKRPSKFPPNLPEFIELCSARDPGVRYLGTPVTPDHAAALDVKTASDATRDEHLAKIRALLSGAKAP
jgi:hypothetical protein